MEQSSQSKMLHSLLKVVAIGTVGDVVSLSTPENRAIVYLGAQSIMNPSLKNRIGFKELLNVAGVKEYVSSSDMGFKLAPRINAAGRMADPKSGLSSVFSHQYGTSSKNWLQNSTR